MSVKYNKVKLFKYGDKGYDLIHLPDGTFVNENGSKKRYDYFCCKCRKLIVPDVLNTMNVPVNISASAIKKLIPTKTLVCPLCKTNYSDAKGSKAKNKCFHAHSQDSLFLVEYSGLEYTVTDGEITRIEYAFIEREYFINDKVFTTSSLAHKLIADKLQRQLYYVTDRPGRSGRRYKNFENVYPLKDIRMPADSNATQQLCNAIMYNFFGMTAPKMSNYLPKNYDNVSIMVYFAVRYPLMFSLIDASIAPIVSSMVHPAAYMRRLLNFMWIFARENKDINELFLMTDKNEYDATIDKYAMYYDHAKSVAVHAKLDPMYAAFMIQMHYLGFSKQKSIDEVMKAFSGYLLNGYSPTSSMNIGSNGKNKIHFGFLISQRTHGLKRFHKSFIKVFGELDWIFSFYKLNNHAAMYDVTNTTAVKLFIDYSVSKYPAKTEFVEMLRQSNSIEEALKQIN